jgi:hypothetical protein
MRTSTRKLSFCIITILICLLLTEAGLHLIYYITNIDKQTTIDGRSNAPAFNNIPWKHTIFKELKEQQSQYEQFIGWRRTEYHGTYTNVTVERMRKTWAPEKPLSSAPQRVYLFGGSTFWGDGVRDEYTIPSLLAKKFYDRGLDFQTYNYGEGAYRFNQEIIQLIVLLHDGHRPDYVIFYDGVNDVVSAFLSKIPGAVYNLLDTRQRLKEKTGGQMIWEGAGLIVKKHSMIYRTITSFFLTKSFWASRPSYTDAELSFLAQGIVDEYVKSMDLLDKLAKAYGFRYICFWQPNILLEEIQNPEIVKRLPWLHDKQFVACNRNCYSLLVKQKLPGFFDITKVLIGNEVMSYIDFCHLSEHGNELVSEQIYQVFMKYFQLDQNNLKLGSGSGHAVKQEEQ